MLHVWLWLIANYSCYSRIVGRCLSIVEMALRYQRMRMLASISLFSRIFSARSRFILILQKRLTPTFILLIIVVLYQ